MYDKLSEERKKLQEQGLCPDWWSTGGYQLFKEKYQYQAANPKEQYKRIAKTLAVHTPNPGKYQSIFFDLMWEGWLSPSTPVLANTGTTRGLPVSCAGDYIADDLSEIYKAKHETAMLTKYGFGTASYLGDIRPRGASISSGGKSSGILPIIQGFQGDMDYVVQGTARRGSWAGYLPIDHGDFDEVNEYLRHHPDGNNVGWNVSNDFIEKLNSKDKEAVRRYSEAMKTKMITGKGYFWFDDKVNAKNPQWYKDKGLSVKSSQLCVAPETVVLTDQGHEIISELEGQIVKVWNGESFTDTVVHKTGVDQQLVKVVTDCGFELDCTRYHKFYVMEGFSRTGKVVEKRACDLVEGDKLIKLDTPVIQGEKVLKKAYQNGFYSGDGCCVKANSRVYLYGDKRKLSYMFTDTRQYVTQDAQDREYFYVDGLETKFFVPTAEYTVESRVEWFAGLMDADGCLLTNGKSQTLQIASTQPGFLESVQLMLQTLGIQSKVKHARDAGKYPLPANDGTGTLKEYDCKKVERLLVNGMGIVKLLNMGLNPQRLKPTSHIPNRDASNFVKIKEVIDDGRVDDTYCFTESEKGMGVFNGILTGQCSEIALHSDEEHTFTCVLASMNLARYDEWAGTDAVYNAIFFLDAVCQEFIERAKNIEGLEKAVRFTRKSRALGLGVCGYHTYLQQNMMPFGSMEAHFFNIKAFKFIREEAERATVDLAKHWGEPEWLKGYGRANTHLIAVAPTKSTALIMGGVSEGINPDTAMVYTQRTPAGEVDRVNPVLLKLMKERGVYNKQTMERIRVDNFGSVQNEDWLTDEEKEVFKIAFEINMHDVIRSASVRSKYIDQWQSLNLFFASGDDPKYINEVHKQAFNDPEIKGLYYVYSRAGIQASVDKDQCSACM